MTMNRRFLHPLHETIHHALLAGLVELDGELVAVDRDHVAVAELDVEDAVADLVSGYGAGRLGDQFAFDGERTAAASARSGATPLPVPPPALTRNPGRPGVRWGRG